MKLLGSAEALITDRVLLAVKSVALITMACPLVKFRSSASLKVTLITPSSTPELTEPV